MIKNYIKVKNCAQNCFVQNFFNQNCFIVILQSLFVFLHSYLVLLRYLAWFIHEAGFTPWSRGFYKAAIACLMDKPFFEYEQFQRGPTFGLLESWYFQGYCCQFFHYTHMRVVVMRCHNHRSFYWGLPAKAKESPIPLPIRQIIPCWTQTRHLKVSGELAGTTPCWRVIWRYLWQMVTSISHIETPQLDAALRHTQDHQ